MIHVIKYKRNFSLAILVIIVRWIHLQSDAILLLFRYLCGSKRFILKQIQIFQIFYAIFLIMRNTRNSPDKIEKLL